MVGKGRSWDLAKELKELVRGGLTKSGLRQRTLILSLPIVRDRAYGATSKANLVRAAEDAIRAGVREFNPRERFAYEFLLMLTEEAELAQARGGVKERRLKAMAQLGERVAYNTFRQDPKYELTHLERLARRILHERRPLSAPTLEEEPIMRIAGGHTPRENYRTRWLKLAYVFQSGRIPAYAILERELEALVDNTDVWWEGTYYTQGNDVVRFEPLSGEDTISVIRALPGNYNGLSYHEMRLRRTLYRGETCTLWIKKIVTDRAHEPLPVFTFASTGDHSTDLVTIRVVFATACLPARVEKIIGYTTHLPRAAHSERFKLRPDGSVETDFTEFQEDMSYGFRWLWEVVE